MDREFLPIIISTTAYIRKNDASLNKIVYGLTDREKSGLRDGSIIVIFDSEIPTWYGRPYWGTTWRQVYVQGNRFYYKLPDIEVLNQIEGILE